MKAIALIIMLCSGAQARVFNYAAKGSPSAIEKNLRDAGFTVDYTICRNEKCELHMPDSERKDPTPVVSAYKDPKIEQAKDIQTIRKLLAKWKAESISPAEKDQLLLLMASIWTSQQP